MSTKSGTKFKLLPLAILIFFAIRHYVDLEPPQWVEGPVTVIDGDTLDMDGARVRLHGIDAPELKQTCQTNGGKEWPCGREAERRLRSLVGGADVTCEEIDVDRYGRIVGRCLAADMDIGREMVRSGYALAYRKYSLDYVVVENEARSARRGVWMGAFVEPWGWRTRMRGVP